MTLNEAFSKLVMTPGWYIGSDYIKRQALRDKQYFLAGKKIPEERMRHYLRAAGWEQTQEEHWQKHQEL